MIEGTAEYRVINRKARSQVAIAIRKGTLVSQPCEVCGATGTLANGDNAIWAHHDDYSKPLEVRWLCLEHHNELHGIFPKVRMPITTVPCPHCGELINPAALLGSLPKTPSEAARAASRNNGKKGGRPRANVGKMMGSVKSDKKKESERVREAAKELTKVDEI